MTVDETGQAPETDFDPTDKPKLKKSRVWLDLIKDFNKAGFSEYNAKADNVDKQLGTLSRLSAVDRSREFQIYWANIQVLGPSVYARPPVPVVVPRFRDRRPLPRTASELLERCVSVNFEMVDIDGTMRLVRDDLTVQARGVPWIRYEAEGKGKNFKETACVDHVSRKDFAHDPARYWSEVDWVARRSYLTQPEMRKRFSKTSGDAYKKAEYAVRKDDNGNTDNLKKAEVWELWSKSTKKVIFITENVDVLLDEIDPPITLDGFFPCPRPAFATVQRESLIPIPGFLYIKDQIEEINQITARLHALAQSIKAKGFYPAGASDLADAIEAALKSPDDRATLVGVPNWAAFGDNKLGDTIVWLPLEQIANVVTGLVALRKQLIDDVYQITGLSDIMRGSTDPRETKGAQELKSQYGSIRIRDMRDELIRVARDVTRMVAEVIAENFQPKSLLDMSQMELPSDRDIAAKVKQIEAQIAGIQQQIQEAQQDPQIQAQMQAKPEVAQQILKQAEQQVQQLQGQAEEAKKTITIDQVVNLLREQRIRPFVLDIETDSTIAPDEDAQKQRANEFVTAMGGFLTQAIQAVQLMPQTAPLMAETMKYMASQYRAGRQLDTAIDEFADQIRQMAGQPQGGEDQTAQKQAEADIQAKQADMQIKQQSAVADQQLKQADVDHAKSMRERETAEKITLMQAEEQRKALEHQQRLEIGTLDIEKRKLELQKLGGQIIADQQSAAIKADQEAQQSAITAEDAERRSTQEEAAFERETVAAERAERRAEMESMRNDAD